MPTPFRNRELPYDHSHHNREMVDFFVTNPIARWVDNPEKQRQFVEIYGDSALTRVLWYRQVPENYDKNQVTNNNPNVHLWGNEPDAPPQAIVPGVPPWAQTLLDKLDLVEKKVDIAVDKIGVILG